MLLVLQCIVQPSFLALRMNHKTKKYLSLLSEPFLCVCGRGVARACVVFVVFFLFLFPHAQKNAGDDPIFFHQNDKHMSYCGVDSFPVLLMPKKL